MGLFLVLNSPGLAYAEYSPVVLGQAPKWMQNLDLVGQDGMSTALRVLACIVALMLPFIVAMARGHQNTIPILLTVVFTAVIFFWSGVAWVGIGWVVALIWSFMAVPKPATPTSRHPYFPPNGP